MKITFVGLLISFLIFTIFLSLLRWENDFQEPPCIRHFSFNQTKVDDYEYVLEIIHTSGGAIKPSKTTWSIMNERNVRIAHNNFPTESGFDGNTDNNITVTWSDIDNDKHISKGDLIRITSNEERLSGMDFRIDDKENLISKEKLN